VSEVRYYFRFNLFHRILHGMVMVSFLGLAVTGLPLKYAQTGWGLWLSHLLGGPFTAGYLHRFFAIITFTYFTLHLGYIARLVLKGQPGIFWGSGSMVPQPRDILQIVQHMRYFLGLGPRPRFGRFAYWEKFDYFAVFWGVAIIGASGLLLWFPTFFAQVLPGWIFNVAILVHSDEALLAVGFIFTIHFFNGHLRPEKFPMDPVIFTGRVEEEEFRRDHPEEYDRLKAQGRLEARRADPPPLWLRNFSLVVGLSALAVGLVLVWLIITTALK
jgi:cytochrome b subunit of formate dehydrogenase